MKVFNLARAIMRKYPDAIPGVNFEVEYDPITEESTVKRWDLPYPQLEEIEARTLEQEAELALQKEQETLAIQTRNKQLEIPNLFMQLAQKDLQIKQQASTIASQTTSINAVKTQNASILLTLAKNGIK